MTPEVIALSKILEKEITSLKFGEITAVMRIQEGSVVFTETHIAKKYKNPELINAAGKTGVEDDRRR